ncbi:MSHA biogenesis protein MshJ [Herbaspirillum sp. HC18]|nr:MSHA biogenesis protein MshJ [Herbaspirillum sp. HC18]
MKQHWERISQRIDALTLRERVIVFALAVVVLLTVINALLLDPQTAKQQQLSGQLKQNQAKIAEAQKEMQQKAKVDAIDPDATTRSRLEVAKKQSLEMHAALKEMQKGVVSPDKMSSVLESILRQNNKLHLVSLRTLDSSGLTEPTVGAGVGAGVLDRGLQAVNVQASGAKEKAGRDKEPVYKHGVELVVQGAYPDLAAYLASLETLPWQLYWGNVRLKVEEYPKATLVFTVFTLSLDKKWLNT